MRRLTLPTPPAPVLPGPARWPGIAKIAAAFVLGLASVFAFAPYHFWPLMLLGLTGLVALIDISRTPRGAFGIGWAFLFGQFCIGFSWIAESFSRQSDVPELFAAPAVAALAAGLALYGGLGFWIARRVWRPDLSRLGLAALVLALADWLRGLLFTGFPWNPLAAIWGGSDAMMQPLALLGTWGWGALTALAFVAPAALWTPGGWVRCGAVAALGLVLPLGGLIYGLVRLPDGPVAAVPGITLNLVQPNISQEDKWRPELRGANLADHLALSQRRGRQTGRWITIWSESAVPFLLLDEDRFRRVLIADALPPGGALITGVIRRDRDNPNRFYNALTAITAEGDVAAVYDKAHLVPFGEYVPLISRLTLLKPMLGTIGLGLYAERGGYLSGPGPQTLTLAGVPPFSPLICYEAIFPGQVIDPDGPRPHWMVNVTNDAWFGTSAGPHQHLVMARMRAVEEGLPMARVAGTGISAVIDPYGRVGAHAELLTRAAFTSPLPQALPPTPFSRLRVFGFFFVILLLAIFFCYAGGRPSRVRKP